MIDMNNFTQFLQIGMEGLFYVTTLIFTGFSLSIVYHWLAYGIHKSHILILLVVYLGISSILFIGMSLALNAV